MRVLIVDDNQELRHTLAIALSLFGWDIEQAENGADALAIHTQKNHELDAILLDQVMPGLDGLDVLPKLLEINPHVPVIMLTAHSSIPLVTTFMQLGGSGFIEKPANHFEILRLRIEEAIRHAQRRRVLEEVRTDQRATAMLNRDKDLFLAKMSHELRTPLFAILQFADLAKRRWMEKKPEEVITLLDRLLAGKERLLHFVTNIEYLARFHTGQMPYLSESGDLVSLVQGVVRKEEHRAGMGRSGMETLSWQVTGDATVLTCFDGALLRVALTELLDNARRFSSPGGMVEIVVTRTGQQVQIVIRDGGPGIPPGEEEAIFAPFTESSRTRSQAGGTGLGLAVASCLVRLHGGVIYAANRADGLGAEVTLVLPDTEGPSK